jgi:hypothetical protein
MRDKNFVRASQLVSYVNDLLHAINKDLDWPACRNVIPCSLIACLDNQTPEFHHLPSPVL